MRTKPKSMPFKWYVLLNPQARFSLIDPTLHLPLLFFSPTFSPPLFLLCLMLPMPIPAPHMGFFYTHADFVRDVGDVCLALSCPNTSFSTACCHLAWPVPTFMVQHLHAVSSPRHYRCYMSSPYIFPHTQTFSWSSHSGTTADAHKPSHSRTPSMSKWPMSPPVREQTEESQGKWQCTFQNEPQSNAPASAYGNTSSAPIVLPVCAVCLRHGKHNIPNIQCTAKRTWDNKHNTYCEQVNKALQTRDGGNTLCSFWQQECGCHEKHDNMHTCSGCGVLTHGASHCPQAEKAPTLNSL